MGHAWDVVFQRPGMRFPTCGSLLPILEYLNYLSLYSTATQNTWRRRLALGNAPDARILRWIYQHVGIFWRYLMLKFAFSPKPTLDASQWNIGCVGSQLAMYISCFLCRFHLRLVPNANPISSGIWALISDSQTVFSIMISSQWSFS